MYYECTHARICMYVCMYVCMQCTCCPAWACSLTCHVWNQVRGYYHIHIQYILYIHTYIYKQLGKSNRCEELLHFLFDDWDVEAVHYQVRVIGNLTKIMSGTCFHIHTYINTYNKYLIRQIVHTTYIHTYNSRKQKKTKIIRWWI